MNYYLDTEFHEYHKQQKVFGIPVGKSIPTIDLISIGIVSGDYIEEADNISSDPNKVVSASFNAYREYYAISKDFNVKDAWNSWQVKSNTYEDLSGSDVKATVVTKEYWLRENVLSSIFFELHQKYLGEIYKMEQLNISNSFKDTEEFTYSNFKWLINRYGKTNKEIAEEIHAFIYQDYLKDTGLSYPEAFGYSNPKYDPTFYAYYADYDWVVFCQNLFGKMIDLPEGFPMYCRDLKQELDDKVYYLPLTNRKYVTEYIPERSDFETRLLSVKNDPRYPKQQNEHNALDDAKWNKELHKFIKNL